MKKILFLMALVPVLLMASPPKLQAQLVVMTSQYSLPTDTVTSTAAKYLYSAAIKGYQKTVSVVVTATEISGTTAGTATLEASSDNISWYPYYNSHDSTYTFSLADVTAAQGYRWKLVDFADQYLRVKVVGISTPNVKISAKYLARKQD